MVPAVGGETGEGQPRSSPLLEGQLLLGQKHRLLYEKRQHILSFTPWTRVQRTEKSPACLPNINDTPKRQMSVPL